MKPIYKPMVTDKPMAVSKKAMGSSVKAPAVPKKQKMGSDMPAPAPVAPTMKSVYSAARKRKPAK